MHMPDKYHVPVTPDRDKYIYNFAVIWIWNAPQRAQMLKVLSQTDGINWRW